MKHYKEVFVIRQFDSYTFDQWYKSLKKIERSQFIRAYHLKKADDVWDRKVTKTWSEWRGLRDGASLAEALGVKCLYWQEHFTNFIARDATASGYRCFIDQIRNKIWLASLRKMSLPSKTKFNPAFNVPFAISKSTPVLLSTSKTSQILMPAPKRLVSPARLQPQDQLVKACERGDEKTVTALLKQGAKPDMANTQGKQPLGAAVWGMCPDVVNALLKQAGGIAPITWDECEKHNLKHYNEVFLIPKFDPQNLGEWNALLQKMNFNEFVRASHLKKADERWHDGDTLSWESMVKNVMARRAWFWRKEKKEFQEVALLTEREYVDFRTQIRQGVKTAKQPTVPLDF